MSEQDPPLSNRLPVLVNRIRDLQEDFIRLSTTAASKALAIGEHLVEAKALCPHGAWSSFLGHAGIPARTAQRYMSLHRAAAKPASLADLGLQQVGNWSEIGLRLWPGDGVGIEVEGEVAEGFRFYSTILPLAEGRAFCAQVFLLPGHDNSFWITKECGSPVSLGILHDRCAHWFDRYDKKQMNEEETRRAAWEWHGGTKALQIDGAGP